MIKEYVLDPNIIEAQSMEIIESLLEVKLNSKEAPIIKRCIHTSADFAYAESLYFSPKAIETISANMKSGTLIITDTNMALAGINKTALAKLGMEINCFISDEDVAKEAKIKGTTRAIAGVEKASKINAPVIFVVGNAPTALIKLYELIKNHNYKTAGIIGAPVGFVNVVESKELIIETDNPLIVARGRKGGSNIAAAIINALMYEKIKENKL